MDARAVLDSLRGFSAEESAELRAMIDTLPDAELAQAMMILREAKASEDALIGKVIENDPDFPRKIESFLHDRLAETKGAEEAADATRADDIARSFDE